MKYEKARSKRLQLLNAAGFDTTGFGDLCIFFTSDQIIGYFDFSSKLIYKLGIMKLALSLSNITGFQYKNSEDSSFQTIMVDKNGGGSYTFKGLVYDKEPIVDAAYITFRYNLYER
jgi:hypothetical protein